MIEMRWLAQEVQTQFPPAQPTQIKVLQYRIKYDPTVYAGFPPAVQTVSHTVWSDWRDVPTVTEQTQPPISSFKRCSKCNIELTHGPMSYVCPHMNCPTGLGSSVS